MNLKRHSHDNQRRISEPSQTQPSPTFPCFCVRTVTPQYQLRTVKTFACRISPANPWPFYRALSTVASSSASSQTATQLLDSSANPEHPQCTRYCTSSAAPPSLSFTPFCISSRLGVSRVSLGLPDPPSLFQYCIFAVWSEVSLDRMCLCTYQSSRTISGLVFFLRDPNSNGQFQASSSYPRVPDLRRLARCSLIRY